MNSNVTGTGDVVDVRQIRPNTFGKYGRTCSANTAEHVRQIRPNRFGQYGRTLAEPFGSAEHSSAKKWFGSVRFGKNRVRSITTEKLHSDILTDFLAYC